MTIAVAPAATITASPSSHHAQAEEDDDDEAPGTVEVVTGTVDVVAGSDVLVGGIVDVVGVDVEVVVGAIVVDVAGGGTVVVGGSVDVVGLVDVVVGLVVVEMPPKVVVVRVGSCEGALPPQAVRRAPDMSSDARMPKARPDLTLTPTRGVRPRTVSWIVPAVLDPRVEWPVGPTGCGTLRGRGATSWTGRVAP